MALSENSSSAVLLNSQLRGFFETTIGVFQGCLLSPILFNLLLKKIMQETLHDYTSMSTGSRPMRNPQLANNTDLTGGSDGELKDLTKRLIEQGLMDWKSA